jgi:hypothetical protein
MYSATIKDNTTDMSVWKGSGGGGGGTASGTLAPGAGGGGAGGATVSLYSTGDLSMHGVINTTGAAGGLSGLAWVWDAGTGGGGAGGGVCLHAEKLNLSGKVDARGWEWSWEFQEGGPSFDNGGTVKAFYTELEGSFAALCGGRNFTNGRPAMNGLVQPADGGAVNDTFRFRWKAATDPEGDPVNYTLIVARDPGLADRVIEEDGLTGTDYDPSGSLSDGEYFWTVHASDYHGRGRAAPVRRLVLDNVAPSSAVSALPGYSTTGEFPVDWNGSDDRSGVAAFTVYVSDNGGEALRWLTRVNITRKPFTGEEGHSYSFWSVAADYAGNIEPEPATPDASTTVDLTPPTSSVAPLSPFQTRTGFRVGWSGRDDGSGIISYTIYVSENGGPFSAWLDNTTARSGNFTGSDGCTYRFLSRALDQAGLLEPMPDESSAASTRVDATAPATTLTADGARFGSDPLYLAGDSNFRLAQSDNCSGPGPTYYAIDGAEAARYKGPVPAGPGGPHTIIYWSEDLAGNLELKSTLAYYVDIEAPETRLVVDGPNITYGGRLVVTGASLIGLLSRDNGSGLSRIEYEIDGSGFRAYLAPFAVEGPGLHTLRYRGCDNLGLVEPPHTVVIALDDTRPATTASRKDDPAGREVRILLSGEDAGSGLCSTWFRIARTGEPPAGWVNGSVAAVALLADHSTDGKYTVFFYSIDGVGNRESERVFNFTVDTVCLLEVPGRAVFSTGKEKLLLSGTAEPGATVTVNGARTLVDRAGNFSAEVWLKRGKNTLEVCATDSAGNRAGRTLAVTYEPPAPATGPDGVLLAAVAAAAAAGAAIGAVVLLRKRRTAPPKRPAPEIPGDGPGAR